MLKCYHEAQELFHQSTNLPTCQYIPTGQGPLTFLKNEEKKKLLVTSYSPAAQSLKSAAAWLRPQPSAKPLH